MMRTIEKLESTTFQSTNLTNARLKYLSNIAEISEDHISRIGLGISISKGEVSLNWSPNDSQYENTMLGILNKEKHIRGKTLFKDDLSLWLALILQHQNPGDYNSWRKIFISHWERGVEMLAVEAVKEKNWIKILNSFCPN